MKIFLLSRTDNLNTELKQALKDEIISHDNKVAYISSEKQTGNKKYYLSTIDDFKEISENVEVDYFDLSSDFSDYDLSKLSDYKVIYLSGGNTYTFLKDAKERNLKSILEKAITQGALLIGASAGSVMMTPTIDICSYADTNDVNLTDTSGFSFVDFEFCPHFTESDLAFLNDYETENDIYLCRDEDGLLYDNGNIQLFGNVTTL